ncbi:MAG: alpha/beta hydrolase [Actinomycetes bacterium]
MTGAAQTRWLLAADGVRISVAHRSAYGAGGDGGPGRSLAFVLAHGFGGSGASPAMRAVTATLRAYGGVLALDFRGHGRSSGRSTVGDGEVEDVTAAVGWARLLGYRAVVTVGWSMGASVVIRHAAATDGVQAVVAVSGPARWFYRGTPQMRLVHVLVERRGGRLASRLLLGTRIAATGWDPLPDAPWQVVGRIAPVPLLVVHGDQDPYFPVEHARILYSCANEPKELWVVPGFGHAESAAGPGLVHRIGAWAQHAVSLGTAGRSLR